jgi:hypothetical protein
LAVKRQPFTEDKKMSDEKATPKKKTISEDAAQAQLDEWLNFYGLDFEDIVAYEGKAAAKTLMNTLKRAIQRAELEINLDDSVTITQHLTKSKLDGTDTVSYVSKKIGRARVAMESGGDNQQSRMNAFMGAMSGIESKEFMKLDGSDLTIADRIFVVFSMV